VFASVVTAAPDRLIFNWVVYERFDAMLEHYAAIVRVYQHAGVRAWTVWVDSGDAAAARALSERGHKLDSQPIAMAAEIAGLILAATGDLDWSETRDAGLVARINGFAYGFPPPAFEAVFDHCPIPCGGAYIARLNGTVAGALLAREVANADRGISGVATLPEARGHGIATRLLAAVLRAAQGRGALTTALQASPFGAKVYTALGCRSFGGMGMWERRSAV
jgi:GNAT superfamily N-acetyltransferase